MSTTTTQTPTKMVVSQASGIPRVQQPLGKPSPYIIPAYEGETITIPGTKSTVRILASAKETEGLISVFGMDGAVADPPGFHYHNLAHDVFMCTKGHLKVWAGNDCKILGPGDFCYVPPTIVHQPQLLDDGINETIGLVTPGQWVDFFRFVAEPYDGVVVNEHDTRNPRDTFGPKMREIKENHDVVFQHGFTGGSLSAWGPENSVLPPTPGVPYYLKANTGPCHLLEGVLSRPFITTTQSRAPTGNFAITSIESSNRLPNTVLSRPFAFDKTHQVYCVLDGAISVTVDGSAQLVRAGETVFVPAGTQIAVAFVDRYVRFWAYSSGDGLEALISEAGGPFEGTIVPDESRDVDVEGVRRAAEKYSVRLSI
ncbi:RmlC-like cupin domain-containing protein [Boeremia exigua]|uniref:RmlC-like cupin domain-containing protein n=1 Tax=Boeremia exigua TaxID=749465 RepID=UPI001E8D3883|nr:RmlC-like cupin domain-containing protein [Boeremia exigua]KAH6619046.1 RmlC-like cupin domain-containing protein [Boeremia exigua]